MWRSQIIAVDICGYICGALGAFGTVVPLMSHTQIWDSQESEEKNGPFKCNGVKPMPCHVSCFENIYRIPSRAGLANIFVFLGLKKEWDKNGMYNYNFL